MGAFGRTIRFSWGGSTGCPGRSPVLTLSTAPSRLCGACLLAAVVTMFAQQKSATTRPDYSAAGMQALEAQKYEAAVEAFTKAVAAEPKDYSAHFNLGLAYTFLHKDA
jgi:Tfp pilus assembly protein PilF